MASNLDFLATLEQEEVRLFEELAKNPVFAGNPGFQRLMKLHSLRYDYRQTPAMEPSPKPEPKPSRAPKPTKRSRKGVFTPKPSKGSSHGSKTKEVVAAAITYLRKTHKRATSGELVRALADAGVDVGGKNPGSSMSAYLANNSKVFDNVKGEGYGLREWSSPSMNNGAAH